jgi:hypothetical protein
MLRSGHQLCPVGYDAVSDSTLWFMTLHCELQSNTSFYAVVDHLALWATEQYQILGCDQWLYTVGTEQCQILCFNNKQKTTLNGVLQSSIRFNTAISDAALSATVHYQILCYDQWLCTVGLWISIRFCAVISDSASLASMQYQILHRGHSLCPVSYNAVSASMHSTLWTSEQYQFYSLWSITLHCGLQSNIRFYAVIYDSALWAQSSIRFYTVINDSGFWAS